jgi:rhomboid protease GluP
MMALRSIAPPVAELYGPGRTVIVYTVAGIVGFLVTSLAFMFLPALPFLHGSAYTVGASASIFGLVGALVYYGRRSGSSLIRGQAMSWALTMFVFGLVMPGIDNFAHAGGFLGGYLTGLVLDPLKPERIDHLVVAVVCLFLSVISVLASVITAFV